jgi:hypothetical protein
MRSLAKGSQSCHYAITLPRTINLAFDAGTPLTIVPPVFTRANIRAHNKPLTGIINVR